MFGGRDPTVLDLIVITIVGGIVVALVIWRLTA